MIHFAQFWTMENSTTTDNKLKVKLNEQMNRQMRCICQFPGGDKVVVFGSFDCRLGEFGDVLQNTQRTIERGDT